MMSNARKFLKWGKPVDEHGISNGEDLRTAGKSGMKFDRKELTNQGRLSKTTPALEGFSADGESDRSESH